MRRRWVVLAVLTISLTVVVTTAAAQGTEEIKWISVLRELGGWGIAGLAIYFFNQAVEKERKASDEREKVGHAREMAIQTREALVIGALQESARVGERLAGAVAGMTELIRERREGLDRALDRIVHEAGLVRHDTRNILAGQNAQSRRFDTLQEGIAACREVVEEMLRRARKEPA